MQAVEDFVLEQVRTAVQNSETIRSSNVGRTSVMKEENPQSLVSGISRSADL